MSQNQKSKPTKKTAPQKPKKKSKPAVKKTPAGTPKYQTANYKSYIGSISKLKRADGKPTRISYPVALHVLVVELANEKDMKISEIYLEAIKTYCTKNKVKFDGTVAPLEVLAKGKKISVPMILYLALKEYLLSHGKQIPNNQVKAEPKEENPPTDELS